MDTNRIAILTKYGRNRRWTQIYADDVGPERLAVNRRAGAGLVTETAGLSLIQCKDVPVFASIRGTKCSRR